MQNSATTMFSLRALLFLCALLFSTGTFASPSSGIKIISRQTAPGQVLSTDLACQQYSRIANLSTIGANSTYRTAFLEASPVGTLSNAALLNQAIAALPILTADADLNNACGNLTTIALQGAAVNFTQGIIAQFTFTGNPASVTTGTIIPVIVLLSLVIIAGPLSAL